MATDYMLGDAINSPGQYRAVFGSESPDKEYLRNPYISPYYGDYTGLPPIYLAVSDTEVLFDDSVKLYEKLKREGHAVGIDIAHGLCHAYPMFPQIPESKRTIAKAVEFLNSR